MADQKLAWRWRNSHWTVDQPVRYPTKQTLPGPPPAPGSEIYGAREHATLQTSLSTSPSPQSGYTDDRPANPARVGVSVPSSMPAPVLSANLARPARDYHPNGPVSGSRTIREDQDFTGDGPDTKQRHKPAPRWRARLTRRCGPTGLNGQVSLGGLVASLALVAAAAVISL